MVFAKSYLAFGLLDLRAFNSELRSVSAVISFEALLLCPQIFIERPELCIPAADLVRTQNKQLVAAFYGLAFLDYDAADYRLPRSLNRISTRCGYQNETAINRFGQSHDNGNQQRKDKRRN